LIRCANRAAAGDSGAVIGRVNALAIPKSVAAGRAAGGGGAAVTELIFVPVRGRFFDSDAAPAIRKTFPHALHLARFPAIVEETTYFFPQSLHRAGIGKKASDLCWSIGGSTRSIKLKLITIGL